MALALAFSGCEKKSESSGGGESSASDAEISSDLEKVAMNGRKLIQGMIQANVERQARVVGPVWPRTRFDEPGESSGAKSATAYFNDLFDTEHYGTDDWDPNVDGDLLSTLGKTAFFGKTIRAEGLDWCMAANVVDETQDFIPILVSANFNLALLLRSFNGKCDTRLQIGPASGAAKSMFGNSAIVIVRKSGAAEVIKAKDLTYGRLYKNQSFDDSRREKLIDYLTPNGVVEPVGHP